METLGIGVVGAHAERGWAGKIHIPAIHVLPEYRLVGVCTTRRESAQAAAQAFSAEHAFTDASEMAGHPDVDVVMIGVRVPYHHDLLATSIQAGRHVFCEWPLTRTTAEAADFLRSAGEQGVHHAVGLQARFAPAFNVVRRLIADGYVGRVLSCTVDAPLQFGGPTRPLDRAFTLDASSGAGATKTNGGHTLDFMCACLADEFESVTATVATQFEDVRLVETGEVVKATAPDQMALTGTLRSGAVASVHLHGAKSNGARFSMAISGTDGDLLVRSSSMSRGLQQDDLEVWGVSGTSGRELERLPMPRPAIEVPGGPDRWAVSNVAGLLRNLANDIHAGTGTVPDFAVAARRHALLDAIQEAAVSGTRQPVADAFPDAPAPG